MSAEDDIFLAEASPIADRRKLPYHMCTILNKISITMCDVSKGGGEVGGLQRNEHMTFLMDKIDMRGFPNATSPSRICVYKSHIPSLPQNNLNL